MNIKVYYKNGDLDIFDTRELTTSGSITSGCENVMTKFHIPWDEFLKDDNASNLNIYIYYYRRNNNNETIINNEKYLDEVLFYDNDQKIFPNPNPQQIINEHKALPYGSMEPGTWFTLVPYERKKGILKIDIDDVTRIYRHHQWHDLIDIFKFTYIESLYLNADEKKFDLENRIIMLFDKLKNIYEQPDGSLIVDDSDIAAEIGVPYKLFIQISKNITKLEAKEEKEETDDYNKTTAENLMKAITDYINNVMAS